MAITAKPKLDARKVRADFPIFEQTVHGKPLSFLDSAASSQKPRQMLEAMTHFYETSYANVHRGVYRLAELATEALEGVTGELLLVRVDRVEPDLFEVVDRGRETDCLGHRRRARLELVRQVAPRRLLEPNALDHVPTEQERLHRLQQLGASPERADAARPAHLVA